MTQREKLKILSEKMRKHSFFEDGPYMISRREAEVILKAMDYQLDKLEYGHRRYEARKDELSKKASERYYNNREEILDKRKKKRFEDIMGAIK